MTHSTKRVTGVNNLKRFLVRIVFCLFAPVFH